MSIDLLDVLQSIRIRRNSLDISNVKDDVRAKTEVPSGLQRDFQTLTLITEAMWEILSEKMGCGEVDLLRKMEEIDVRDGVKDGKSSKIKQCNACGRKINPARARCIFCGNEEVIESAFEKIDS